MRAVISLLFICACLCVGCKHKYPDTTIFGDWKVSRVEYFLHPYKENTSKELVNYRAASYQASKYHFYKDSTFRIERGNGQVETGSFAGFTEIYSPINTVESFLAGKTRFFDTAGLSSGFFCLHELVDSGNLVWLVLNRPEK